MIANNLSICFYVLKYCCVHTSIKYRPSFIVRSNTMVMRQGSFNKDLLMLQKEKRNCYLLPYLLFMTIYFIAIVVFNHLLCGIDYKQCPKSSMTHLSKYSRFLSSSLPQLLVYSTEKN